MAMKNMMRNMRFIISICTYFGWIESGTFLIVFLVPEST